jgi:hypothetical protein
MTLADRTKTSLRRRTVLATAIAVIGLTGAANAFADPVDLRVVDRETGQPLQIWRHHGRLFIAGQPGARYSLRLTNHTDGRVLLVLSVDGVNVLTGETANYDQSGYVLKAYQTYDVSGWRKSDTEVAAFTFAPLPQSYAARTGRPTDVGVIGMAVFKERAAIQAPAYIEPENRPDWRDESSRRSLGAADARTARLATPPDATAQSIPERRAAPVTLSPPPPLEPPPAPMAPPLLELPPAQVVVPAQRSASAPSIAAAPGRLIGGAPSVPQDEKLGTAHGAREWSVVTKVAFARATPYPQTICQIEYDSYDNLVASGVIRPSRSPGYQPRPFPLQPDGAGYVPDPPNEP